MEDSLKANYKRRTFVENHEHEREEFFINENLGLLNNERLSDGLERYFISFINLYSRFAYVEPVDFRANTPEILTTFLHQVTESFGKPRTRFISDNVGKYMISVVEQNLGTMDITHVQIVRHNKEETGMAER